MTLHIVSDSLQQRVTTHLNQFGTLARSVLWTGKGSIVVHFAEPMNVTATDTRFAPLTVNWSATFRSPDGAIYLNVPASWRKADREAGEGEANVTAELTPLMKDLLNVLADGAVAHRVKQEAHFADGRKVGFAANSLKGLIGRGFAEKRTSTDADVLPPVEEYVITAAGRAAINRPIADPTTPIPANELENADEPHSDIGTLVSDEAPLTVPDQAIVEAAKPIDPYAWATPERRAEVAPIIEKLMPIDLYPSKTEGVWQIEDAVTEKTMRRGLSKFNVTNLTTEEDEMDGEPYTIARFSLGKALDTPYPSKRQTKPAADAPSIHAQYDALHDTLPAATQLLIQANGDEWLAFQMDAMLLRRYAPLCRFAAQTVNNAGEQWDKLTVPAGVLDELVTLATEGGLTLALASIVRDEPGALPLRDVTEIHRPGEPVQYVGKEAPPTEWETEADDEPPPEPAPKAEPAAPSKLDMTPELWAAKIRLNIVGGLRLGLVESVTPMPHDGWFAVTFVHGLTETFTVPALRTVYEVGDVWRSKRTVYVRAPQTATHGSAIEQAEAVLNTLPDLTAPVAAAFADAKARMDAFTGAEQAAKPTTLLSEADEAVLIETLRAEHADIAAEALGITQFLLNVIARMRTTATVAAPY